MDASFAYRHIDGHSASPVRMVVMLYEQMIKDLQRAVAAFEKKDVQARTNEINHALQVVGQLQGTLDMEKGGEVARNLDRYYYGLRTALLEAHFRNTPEPLRGQITTLLEMREAWAQVDRSMQQASSQSTPQADGHVLGEAKLSWSI